MAGRKSSAPDEAMTSTVGRAGRRAGNLTVETLREEVSVSGKEAVDTLGNCLEI